MRGQTQGKEAPPILYVLSYPLGYSLLIKNVNKPPVASNLHVILLIGEHPFVVSHACARYSCFLFPFFPLFILSLASHSPRSFIFVLSSSSSSFHLLVVIHLSFFLLLSLSSLHLPVYQHLDVFLISLPPQSISPAVTQPPTTRRASPVTLPSLANYCRVGEPSTWPRPSPPPAAFFPLPSSSTASYLSFATIQS